MWILDRNGLMLGVSTEYNVNIDLIFNWDIKQIYFGAFLTTFGISLRALSSAEFVVNLLSLSIKSQFIVAMVGQALAGCAQPFVLFTPTKVAEFWFPTSQRALATTITGMSNPIGIVLGNLISPLIVTHFSRIPFLVWIFLTKTDQILPICVILKFAKSYHLLKRERTKVSPFGIFSENVHLMTLFILIFVFHLSSILFRV